MKRIYWMIPTALALCVAPFAISGAMAATRNRTTAIVVELGAGDDTDATLGKATADFSNARYDRTETAWGRLVADALRAQAKTDIALVNAGTLERGTLQSGDISRDDISALLSFGDDDVATVQLTGAQLRAALERGVSATPTGSPAWLHLSGMTANYDANAKSGKRIVSLKVGGRDVESGDMFSVAMPVGLAQGGSGYYKVWNNAPVNDLNVTLTQAIANFVHARREISPDNKARVSG